MNKEVENKLGHAKREIAALNKKLRILKTECNKLRMDAGRYRWLREYFCSVREDLDDFLVEACEDNDTSKLDAAIDTAMQEKNHDNQ